MAGDMLDQFNVVDVLVQNEIRVDPLCANGSNDALWAFTAAGPGNGVFDLFYGFDSKYHNNDHNQKQHVYNPGGPRPSPSIGGQVYPGWDGKSSLALGTEVNYFFQGILFRAFGVSAQAAEMFAGTWKAASRHGDLNTQCKAFIADGHRALPDLWPRVLALYNEHKTNESAMQRRKEVARSKLIQSANKIIRR